MIERICQGCGKRFYAYPSRNQKYCSPSCFYHQKVEIKCQNCGKSFWVKPSVAKRGKKYCSRQCQIEYTKKRNSRVCEYCGKIFIARLDKLKWGYSRFCSHSCADKYYNEPAIETQCLECGKKIITTKYRISRGQGKYCSRKCRDKYLPRKQEQSKIAKQRWASLGYRQHMVEVNKRNWQNPSWVKKMLIALNKKPTQPEKLLDALLEKHFPQFRYNGDGKLGIVLGGYVPDFINVNGKKEVIEVFGNYYHSPKVLAYRWQGSELGRIMIYNSLGYNCLIIWESELKAKTDAEIVKLIEDWEGNYGKRGRTRSLKI